MRRQCRALVTGAGSGVGQGIVKALRISGLPVTIVAADIAPMNAALYRADEAVLIPRVENPNALDRIIELLLQNRIDVVLIGSEIDLAFFSFNKTQIELRASVSVIVAPPDTIRIAADKWLTAEFLRKKGLPYAEAYLPENQEDAVNCAEEWSFPVVLKTRCGTSSRDVHIVRDRESLRMLFSQTPFPMLQQVIDFPSSELGSEYTCSVFKTFDGSIIGPFTARRTVRGGTSWHIEVQPFEELFPTLLAIGNSFKFSGSLNVQLMLTEKGPIPFEINARFSGTTAVRAHFGFNEAEMALCSFLYNEVVSVPKVHTGVAIRYHEEVFIDNTTEASLSLLDRGIVNQWF